MGKVPKSEYVLPNYVWANTAGMQDIDGIIRICSKTVFVGKNSQLPRHRDNNEDAIFPDRENTGNLPKTFHIFLQWVLLPTQRNFRIFAS